MVLQDVAVDAQKAPKIRPLQKRSRQAFQDVDVDAQKALKIRPLQRRSRQEYLDVDVDAQKVRRTNRKPHWVPLRRAKRRPPRKQPQPVQRQRWQQL